MAPPSSAPAEAVEHYRGRTARLLSCLTAVHVVVRAYYIFGIVEFELLAPRAY